MLPPTTPPSSQSRQISSQDKTSRVGTVSPTPPRQTHREESKDPVMISPTSSAERFRQRVEPINSVQTPPPQRKKPISLRIKTPVRSALRKVSALTPSIQDTLTKVKDARIAKSPSKRPQTPVKRPETPPQQSPVDSDELFWRMEMERYEKREGKPFTPVPWDDDDDDGKKAKAD